MSKPTTQADILKMMTDQINEAVIKHLESGDDVDSFILDITPPFIFTPYSSKLEPIKQQLEQNGFEDVTVHWIGNDDIVYSEDMKVSDLPDDLNTKT